MIAHFKLDSVEPGKKLAFVNLKKWKRYKLDAKVYLGDLIKVCTRCTKTKFIKTFFNRGGAGGEETFAHRDFSVEK